jgi:two-component system OmpR family sensor kinase
VAAPARPNRAGRQIRPLLLRVGDRRHRYLETLERILAIDALDFRTALTRAADLVAETLEAEKVDVFVYDPPSDRLVAMGTSRTPLGDLQRRLGLDRLPMANGGRAARAALDGQPFLTTDSSQDSEELPALPGALGIRATLIVPFTFEPGGPVAVLNVNSTRVGAFSEADLSFAIALARWIALAGHRAQLAERVAASARDEGRRAAAEEIVMMVAHDLRNLLAPALGRVQLLKRRATGETRASVLRDADAAERALNRASRLISDLLDVARLDQGLFELTPGAVELVPLLDEVSSALVEPGKRITVRASEEVVLTADAARLRQVFENVLSNAVKHARTGTDVVVEATVVRDGPEAPGWAQVDVSNDGPTIPPELAARIFSRFARERGSTGLGLGLHLAREIAVAHGGTIGLEPVQTGARFRVRLPLASA